MHLDELWPTKLWLQGEPRSDRPGGGPKSIAILPSLASRNIRCAAWIYSCVDRTAPLAFTRKVVSLRNNKFDLNSSVVGPILSRSNKHRKDAAMRNHPWPAVALGTLLLHFAVPAISATHPQDDTRHRNERKVQENLTREVRHQFAPPSLLLGVRQLDVQGGRRQGHPAGPSGAPDAEERRGSRSERN
jgi:hypothetical protein